MLKKILFTIFISLITAHTEAADLRGTVTKVIDGDTFKFLTGGQLINVRLAEIDAPEMRQPYGPEAKRELIYMSLGKPAVVHAQTTDHYGRTIATVECDGYDLGRELIKRGAAHVYEDYSRDKTLLVVQMGAKISRRGLWGLPAGDRIEPWIWRKMRRAK